MKAIQKTSGGDIEVGISPRDASRVRLALEDIFSDDTKKERSGERMLNRIASNYCSHEIRGRIAEIDTNTCGVVRIVIESGD